MHFVFSVFYEKAIRNLRYVLSYSLKEYSRLLSARAVAYLNVDMAVDGKFQRKLLILDWTGTMLNKRGFNSFLDFYSTCVLHARTHFFYLDQ